MEAHGDGARSPAFTLSVDGLYCDDEDRLVHEGVGENGDISEGISLDPELELRHGDDHGQRRRHGVGGGRPWPAGDVQLTARLSRFRRNLKRRLWRLTRAS